MPDDEFFIRRFATARDSGDAAAATEAWNELMIRNRDRIAGFVRLHTFTSGSRLRPEHYDDALQCALLRVLKMAGNFRGSTAAEYRAALKTATYYGCMDFGRELMAHEKGIAGSLDETYEDGDADGGRLGAKLAQWLDEMAREAAETAERARSDVAFVRWAIGKIPNEEHREVVRLTFDGKSAPEIAAAVGTSIPNVHQRRSRGMRTLERIIRDNAA